MKIFIVDDKKENIYMLKVLLEGRGYEVVTAENGVEALKGLKKDHIDMIISDILMPKMDGFQLCRKCKSDNNLKKIPFIFYTASYTSKKDEEFGLSLGADRFLIKPIAPKPFLNTINEVFKEHAEKKLVAPKKQIINEEGPFEKKYNERLFKKLEEKMLDLDNVNKNLRQEISERKNTEEALQKLKDELEIKVDERTKELNEKLSELEHYKEATVDREFRMKELRDKIKELESKLR